MNAVQEVQSLLDRMGPIRGSLHEHAPLSKMTWFRTGGPAEILCRPADTADLSRFLKGLDRDIPVSLIGVGSNLLIRDGGIDGIVIKLGKPFSEIIIEGDEIRAGAGAMGVTVAHKAAEHCLAGLEFLHGIPGTVGGAIAMNAGAYGSEVKDILKSVTAIDRTGTVHNLDAEALSFSYRYAGIPEGWIIVEASFRGKPDERSAVQERMQAIRDAREESQPLRIRTGGSTFKNPNSDSTGKIADETGGKKAWELIEEAGCRAMRRGGAMVSEKHCNFLINTGLATSAELEALGEEIRARVKHKSGVELEWEIRRMGRRCGGRG